MVRFHSNFDKFLGFIPVQRDPFLDFVSLATLYLGTKLQQGGEIVSGYDTF
jgi:hypothetical protein